MNEAERLKLLSMDEASFEQAIGFTQEDWLNIKAGLRAREEQAPAIPGSLAPEFSAIRLNEKGELTQEHLSLKQLKGKVIGLVLGSYSCPVFRSHIPRINNIYAELKDVVNFAQIYTYEMHPVDGWLVQVNLKDEVIVKQPTSLEERAAVAKSWMMSQSIEMPVALDHMDNVIDALYSGAPERLYVIDESGIIRFRTSPGPFDHSEVEGWGRALQKCIEAC